MLNGVLDNRLQRQGRQAEEGMRRVVFYEEAFGILGLLHSQIGARVLQFRRKRDERIAGHGREVLAQVGGEIHDDLLGLPGILTAEAINARQGVVNEVRPHLQHHNADTLLRQGLLLPGDLPLVLQILLDLIGEDDDIHRECADGDAEDDQCVYR